MNSEKAISIFGLAMGIGLFIFGIIGASGALSFIEPKRTWLIFFFAILLIIWHWLSFKSLRKAKQNKAAAEAVSGGQSSSDQIAQAKAGQSPEEAIPAAEETVSAGDDDAVVSEIADSTENASAGDDNAAASEAAGSADVSSCPDETAEGSKE